MLHVVKETSNSLLNPDTNSRSCAGGPKISHEPGYLYICLRKGDKDTNVDPPNPWSKKQGVTAIVIVVTVCANCQQVLQGLSVTKGHQLELFLVAALTECIYPKWGYRGYPNSWMVYTGKSYQNGNLHIIRP